MTKAKKKKKYIKIPMRFLQVEIKTEFGPDLITSGIEAKHGPQLMSSVQKLKRRAKVIILTITRRMKK